MRFQDALDRKGEEIERPPLVPIGTYLWTVSGVPDMATIADGRFDVVDFKLKCLAPQEDVDPDALEEFTEKSGSLQGLVRRHRFLFSTEDEGKFKATEFRMKTFVEQHLGVSMVGKSWKESLAECPNHQCLASIKWRPDPRDTEIMYDEIDRTAPAT